VQQINVNLINNKAEIINFDTIYIDVADELQINIVNDLAPGDKVFYTQNPVVKAEEIINKSFVIHSNDLSQIRIALKRKCSVSPELFLLDFPVRNIKIIGPTLDQKYPQAFQQALKDIELLKKAVLTTYNELQEKKKEGVIE